MSRQKRLEKFQRQYAEKYVSVISGRFWGVLQIRHSAMQQIYISFSNLWAILGSATSKLHMSRVSKLTGIPRNSFWTEEKHEPLPADYWDVLENAVANPD